MTRTRWLVVLTVCAVIAIAATGIFFAHKSTPLAIASFALAAALITVFGVLASRQPVSQAKAEAPEIGPERVYADLLYEFANSRLDRQKSAIDSIDAKLGLIFSVGSAEIGALAAFLALSPSPKAGESFVLAASFASYLVLAGIAARGLWTRHWLQGPVVAEVVEAYSSLEKNVVKLAVAQSMIDAFDDNEGPVADKVLGLKIVIVALIAQTLCLLVTQPLVT